MQNPFDKEDRIMNKTLLKLLECPVCLKPMVAPIELCSNGHNICKDCKRNVQTCPICRAPYSGMRNRLAEDLTQMLLCRCENTEAGCSITMPLNEIKSHELCCSYRLYKCFITSCTWRGRTTEMETHFCNSHKECFSKSNYILSSISTLSRDWKKYGLISQYGERFWYFFHFNPSYWTLFVGVQYVGPKEKASDFKYQLNITSKNNSRSIIMTHNTHIDDQDKVMKSKQCLEVRTENMEYFMNTDKLVGLVLTILQNEHGESPNTSKMKTYWSLEKEWKFKMEAKHSSTSRGNSSEINFTTNDYEEEEEFHDFSHLY